MSYTLHVNNGPTMRFNAVSRYTRVFTYNLDGLHDDYFNVTFFLTDYKDILMTIGRTHGSDEIYTDAGKYTVPFIRKIRSEDIDKLAVRNILGIKMDVSNEDFIKRINGFLDDIIGKEFWVRPFSSPKSQKNISSIIPFLEMLKESTAGANVKDKVSESINLIESKLKDQYGDNAGISFNGD